MASMRREDNDASLARSYPPPWALRREEERLSAAISGNPDNARA